MPGILSDITRGFGTRFLQHIDRCKIMVFVIDASLPPPNEPNDQYKAISNIIQYYDYKYVKEKPSVIVINKIDKITKEQLYNLLEKFKANFPHLPVIPVSVEKKININKFLMFIRDIYVNSIENEKKEK
jgi:GTPase